MRSKQKMEPYGLARSESLYVSGADPLATARALLRKAREYGWDDAAQLTMSVQYIPASDAQPDYFSGILTATT